MLDISLFRSDPDRIRESQRRRFANVEIVDEVIALYVAWRRRQLELYHRSDELEESIFNELGNLLKISAEEEEEEEDDDYSDGCCGWINEFCRGAKGTANLKSKMDEFDVVKAITDGELEIARKDDEVKAAKAELDAKLMTIGNLVHDSVPVSSDKADNLIVRTWGEPIVGCGLRNHVYLMEMLGIVTFKNGAKVAGGGDHYLKGNGALLNMALFNFGLTFLRKRNYDLLHTPYLMGEEIMDKRDQLPQSDEDLYKVVGDGDDKYIIGFSEQPSHVVHQGGSIYPESLPMRYAGFSTCFQNKAEPHGRDTMGVYGIHQFGKVEQYCVTAPHGNDSWDMLEEVLKNSEDFYKELKIPYRIVSIVSGALNDATAKKYDLEGWFPASKTYRELVSCSNCTDYQARRLGIRYGQVKDDEEENEFIHLIHSTLTATERTVCCILENYQRGDGVEIPEALRPFMGGIDFIPFKQGVARGKR